LLLHFHLISVYNYDVWSYKICAIRDCLVQQGGRACGWGVQIESGVCLSAATTISSCRGFWGRVVAERFCFRKWKCQRSWLLTSESLTCPVLGELTFFRSRKFIEMSFSCWDISGIERICWTTWGSRKICRGIVKKLLFYVFVVCYNACWFVVTSCINRIHYIATIEYTWIL
jgi:hypothetical protein